MNDAHELTNGFLVQPVSYTQPAILQRMLTALTSLPTLTTRDNNDPIIALLDAWAMVLDVLSFYQQQFNQETYLKTATELLSVRNLARMINYELTPGIAASVYLAFEVDPSANNTGIAFIPKGTQVQSLPTQGDAPQTFETSQDLTPRAEWNQLSPYRPKIEKQPIITGATTSVWLNGVSAGFTKGDMLLLLGSNSSGFSLAYALEVQSVSPDNALNRTAVTWQGDWSTAAADLSNNGKALAATDILNNPQFYVFQKQVGAFGNNAPLVGSLPTTSYYMRPGYNDWDAKSQVPPNTTSSNIPGTIPTIWQNSQAQANTPFNLYLDQMLPEILKGSWVLLATVGTSNPNQQVRQLFKVTVAKEVAQVDFGISGNVTGLVTTNNLFDLIITDTTGAYPTESYINLDISDISQKLQASRLVKLNASPTSAPNATTTDIFLTGGNDVTKTVASSATPLELIALKSGSIGNMIKFAIKRPQSFPSPGTAFQFRTTTIYTQSELLALYVETVDDDNYVIANNKISLDSTVFDLQPEQNLIISNLPTQISEQVSIEQQPTTTKSPFAVTLKDPLQFSYQPGTTNITGVGMEDPIAVTIDNSKPDKPMLLCYNSSNINPIPSHAAALTLTGQLLQQSEVFTLKTLPDIDEGHTVLTLQTNLKNRYKPATSIIYGNIVAATNGATVTEVLGSGDGTQVNQRFSLQKTPLTYLPGSNAAGIQSTLEIRVNNVLWHEVAALYDLDSNSKSYQVTREDNGQINILFGDGVQGARLPTGQENIVATYRQGIGTAGEVTSNSLVLLQTRPQGIISVNNPTPAAGAADPETITTANKTAPSAVLTMGRLVSTSDFEDYTRAYTGISKALSQIMQQNRPILYITIAGDSGKYIDPTSTLYKNLTAAIAANRNPGPEVQMASYEPLQFNVSAKLAIDPTRQTAVVINQVTQALLTAYNFDNQELAENITAGGVIATMRAVDGVLAVDLDALHLSTDPAALHPILTANPATIKDANTINPAQLLTINTKAINLA